MKLVTTSQPELETQPSIPAQKLPTPQKSNHSQVFILVILILIGIASYFGHLYWQLRQQVSQNPPSATPLITPTTASDPTANWNIYTNSKYGFNFRYKPDGVLTEGSNPSQILLVRVISGNDTLELFIQENQKNLPLNDYIQRYGGDYPGKSAYEGTIENNKTIGSISGTYIVFPKAIKSQFDTSGVSQHFYFVTNKYVFWFRLMQSKDLLSENDKIYLSQVLSTFKFSSDTSSEKDLKKLGYIKSIIPVHDSYHLVALYANWIDDKTQPNGYRIEQPSAKLVTLPLEFNPEIVLQKDSHADLNRFFDKPITLSEFISLFESNAPIRNALYWLEMKNGTVTKITEQYQP